MAVDVIVSNGDVIDDNVDRAGSVSAGQPSEDHGQRFFESLVVAADVPILAVPGNHDWTVVTDRLIDGLDPAANLHRRAVTVSDGRIVTDGGGEVTFVRWGVEQFDQAKNLPGFDLELVEDIAADQGLAPSEVIRQLE